MGELKKKLHERKGLKWLVLIMVGIVLFGNYYFYDALSPLKTMLQEEFSFTNTHFGLFVSFYSVPNTFLLMAVIGGIILDRFGIRRTGFWFIFFMTFGAVLTAYASTDYFRQGGVGNSALQNIFPEYTPELKLMLLGRFFYGLGAETSIVVISKILVKWFKGKDLALAFGLKIFFGRMGTVAALNLSPIVSPENTSILKAVWLAAFIVMIGLLIFLVYMILDLGADKGTAEKKSLLSEREKFNLKDIRQLLTNPTFLYVAALCVTFYSAVFPFISYAPDFLKNEFGFNPAVSGRITSIIPFFTMIATPLIGLYIDRFGKSASVMIYGALALFIVHINFAFIGFSPYISMAIIGIAFSMVPASMWPTVVKLVDEKRVGSAYGLMYSIQNLGLWGVPILAGMILDKSNPSQTDVLDYTPTMILFAALGLIGFVFALLLKRINKKRKLGIDLPLNSK